MIHEYLVKETNVPLYEKLFGGFSLSFRLL